MRQMFYYVSIIVMALEFGNLTEHSVTGPFQTKEDCLNYSFVVELAVNQSGSQVKLSECKQKRNEEIS